MSYKSSTALRNAGAGAALVGFATLQGVGPASTANQLDAPPEPDLRSLATNWVISRSLGR